MKTNHQWLQTKYFSHPKQISIIGGLFLFFVLVFHPTATTAQDQSQNYWRYSASREIDQIIISDVNHDGVDEFVLAAESGRIDLLSSDGILQWSYRDEADLPVRAVNTLNIDKASHPPQEIVLISNNQLTLLDNEGNELWQKRLKTAVTPQTIFTTGGLESEDEWEAGYQIQPTDIQPFDYDGDGRDEILLLLNNGQLFLYDGEGNEIWRNDDNNLIPVEGVIPLMSIGDMNQDNVPEIALGYFNPERRYSELAVIGADGLPVWKRNQAFSGRVTAVDIIPFIQNGELQIAVATDRGDLHLYNYLHEKEWWARTLNKSITALTFAHLQEGPALIAGTEVGVVVAYAPTGQRYWTRYLAPNADRAIINLSAASYIPDNTDPTLAVVLAAEANSGRPNDVILLGNEGRTYDSYQAADTSGLTRLLDINRDENSELLLVRFATLELLGIGKGASEIASEWTYPLDAAPSSLLVVDFDNDGDEELLVGARDGRLHYLQNRNAADWIVAPGGDITHLAIVDPMFPQAVSQNIVVIRNNINFSPNGEESYQSWIELRATNGEQLWEVPLEEAITDVIVHDLDNHSNPEIIVSTSSGNVYAYDVDGNFLWNVYIYEDQSFPEDTFPPSIRSLHVVQDLQKDHPRVIAVTSDEVYSIRTDFFLGASRIAKYDDHIQGIYNLDQPGHELATALFLLTGSHVTGLTWRGIQMPTWPLPINTEATISIPANDIIEEAFEEQKAESFLVATKDNHLLRINVENNEPLLDWTLDHIEDVTSLYWGDVDGDALPEFFVGSNEESSGMVRLYSYQQQLLDELPLASGVFALDVLHREEDEVADLVVVSENGDIQLFRPQENRPPLLTNPTTEVTEGQYSVSISVADVEADNVMVRLETWNKETGSWVSQGEALAPTGNERLFWLVKNLPQEGAGVDFRFFFNDGAHQGYILPVTGPSPIGLTGLFGIDSAALLLLAIIGSAVIILFIRQTQLPTVRARRFYRQLRKSPPTTLLMIEKRYLSSQGSPDLLLNLASTARQDNNRNLSNLSDGLYLLPDRPYVALPIINGTLENIQKSDPNWEGLDRWELMFNTGQALFEASSITELSLLRPQLVELLDTLEEEDEWSPTLGALLPILTNLRDSERVNRPEDRLVYLTEAVHRLNELQRHLPEFSPRIQKTLTAVLVNRWFGLVNAEREELRGRAELHIVLKSKRIVPSTETFITLEIANNGRAPAENIIVALEEGPAYEILSAPEIIEFLPPDSPRQVNFHIVPKVPDRFRVGVTVTFDDRNQRSKVVAFGDMVHLLLPIRDFTPIENPYLPGTPLRSNSTIFYGRQQLFNFIADNAGGWSQRNVLILIGQRRTGKTSLLLRLEKMLPEKLLPVYIDCQSLGVISGMANFFHDLAWLISDALAMREIELPVPDLPAWESNPTGEFQRRFIPLAQSLLPEQTTLLLVFDEFEAFENLVDDGILPPTIFSFMRHLMQHSEGLSFIFVGSRRLEEMSADYWSVLFNIALYARIDYLSEQSAVPLITEPVAPNLIYDDLAIDKILRATAGHPYFLQLVCYTLVKQANDRGTGYVTISDVNDGLDEMLSLGEVHFAYLWQRSSATERALLTAVSHMDADLAFHPEDLMEFLEQYNIFLNPIDVTTALHQLVEREIMREVTQGATMQYELKIGLVGLWIVKHKSISKLHAMFVEDTQGINGDGQKGTRSLPKKVKE